MQESGEKLGREAEGKRIKLKRGRPKTQKKQSFDHPSTIKLIWKRGMVLYGYKRNQMMDRDTMNMIHKEALKVVPFLNGQKKYNALLDSSFYFSEYGWLVAKANSKTDEASLIRKEAVTFFNALDSKAFGVTHEAVADMDCMIRKDSAGRVVQAMVFATMFVASHIVCYLELFGVSKDYQGRGLGKQAILQLSDCVDSHMNRHGVRNVVGVYIVVQVSRELKPHGFYRKLGFKNGTPFGFESWSNSSTDIMNLSVDGVFSQDQARLRLADLISSKTGKVATGKVSSKKQMRDDDEEEKKSNHCDQELAANTVNKPAIKRIGSPQKEQSEDDETQSEDDGSRSFITGITSKTKAGAYNKHCMMGKCDGKRISGAHWARHAYDVHSGSIGDQEGRDYVKCAGTGCNACSQGKQGYNGKKKTFKCEQCGTPKRYDQFPKDQKEVCKLCLGGGKSQVGMIAPQLNKRNLKQLPTASVQDRVIQPSDSISQVGSKRVHSQIAAGGEEVKEPSLKREKFEGYIPSGVGGDMPMEEPHQLEQQSTHSFKEVQVVVAHTDQAVINQLEVLEKSKLHKVVCAQEVQELCTMFTQDLILKYIASGKHEKLIDSIISVLQRVDQLEDDAVVGLAVASIVLGNACWEGTIKMFSQMELERREKVFVVFKIHLQKHFNDELAEWLLKYWRVTEQQQLEMLTPVKSSLSATEVLTLSLAVAVQDIPLFVKFASAFIKTSTSSADMILESIIAKPKQRKITFDQLLELAELIQQKSNAPVIESIKETLAATHVCEWVTLIKEKQIGLNLLDAASIQMFLDELIGIYGEIKQLEKDLTQCDDPMYEMVVHEAANKPNNRQFALAQYCIGKLYTCQRQLWVVPSGQGKSRIAAFAIVIGLMSEMFTKVHMVFENQHLLDRDKADFQDILLMLGYDETRFEYHIDLNFVCQLGELVIIDEADCFMFKDPSAFKLFAAEACCLCFTATPDNQDPKGVEARVITALEFQRFNYSQAGADVVKVSLEVDETIQCETLEERAQYIKGIATQGPVHVYCDPPLTEQLKTAGCNPLVVNAATDYQVLRQLDQRVNGSFRVVVAQDQFAMRGLDYRSEQVKMTQVIDKSFENQREAIQGFNRVGRFGDKCTRVKFNGVKIIDDKMSLAYTAKLFRFYAEMQKKKEHLVLKPVAVKKAKRVTEKAAAITTIKSNMGQKRFNALLGPGQSQIQGYFKK